MEYRIVGDVMQALQITLKQGEEVFAEAGSMLYMANGVELQAKMQGGVMKGLMRKFLAGESMFMSVFRSNVAEGKLALANPIAGKIFPLELRGTDWSFSMPAETCWSSISGRASRCASTPAASSPWPIRSVMTSSTSAGSRTHCSAEKDCSLRRSPVRVMSYCRRFRSVVSPIASPRPRVEVAASRAALAGWAITYWVTSFLTDGRQAC